MCGCACVHVCVCVFLFVCVCVCVCDSVCVSKLHGLKIIIFNLLIL